VRKDADHLENCQSDLLFFPAYSTSSTSLIMSFSYRFGKPAMTFLLYSSLTMISLEYLWTRFDYEETRLNGSQRIEKLENQLAELKTRLQVQQNSTEATPVSKKGWIW
jgi:hypothetical protein